MTNQKAILAGGCFWGMQDLFRRLEGVVSTRVGYAGGALENPTYNDIKTGKTGHAEALEVVFDPARISYHNLLLFFFQMHDPTTKNRQGNDVGTQYRSSIFALDDEQVKVAQEVIRQVDASGRWPSAVATEIVSAGPFYAAEEYHQDYLEKHPGGYTCHWVRPNWVLPK